MNVLGMGPMELLLIVVLALIVFGPAKLPEIMGQVGKAIGDFRRATSDLSDEFNRTIQSELQETRALVDDARSTLTEAKTSLTDVHSSVNSAVTGLPAPVRMATPAEALPAPNGVSAEPRPEHLTNGSLPAAAVPPPAAAPGWSWETAAPAPPKPAAGGPPATSAEASSTAEPHSPATTPEADGGTPTQPASQPAGNERVGRDELSPPY